MTTVTTALLRRIERERVQAVQDAWADRKEGRIRKAPPKWAVDHLLRVGAISAEWHTNAQAHSRDCECMAEISRPATAGVSFERVDSALIDPHARKRVLVKGAADAVRVRSMVLRALKRKPAVERAYLQMFNFPQASWKTLCGDRSGNRTEEQAVAAIEAVAEARIELGLTDDQNIGTQLPRYRFAPAV